AAPLSLVKAPAANSREPSVEKARLETSASAVGFQVASSAPVPVADSRASRLRALPAMVAKAPPAKTLVPSGDSTRVCTAPSAAGAQAVSRAPVAALTAAREGRAVLPILVNPPP